MERKKTKLNLLIFILMLFLLVFSKNVNAGWSLMDGNWEIDDGLYDVWAYSPTEVFISGCFGTRLHFDGNSDEMWFEWPEIQGH